MFPIYEVVFFVFSIFLIASALMVVLSQNPVHAILCLILSFLCSAVLWMCLRAEFLALVLIFVYIGAVMTLFLFVVMMLNIDLSAMKLKFKEALPVGLLVLFLFVGVMVTVMMNSKHFSSIGGSIQPMATDQSNVKTMGMLLYTQYLYPFEIAGVILLVAIVAAITLVFHGRKPDAKAQRIREQLRANKQERLRIVDIPPTVKKSS